ncbi:MAG: hypothetical protein WCB96_05040, partial [Candidatus Aminicenantales bacterium]
GETRSGFPLQRDFVAKPLMAPRSSPQAIRNNRQPTIQFVREPLNKDAANFNLIEELGDDNV